MNSSDNEAKFILGKELHQTFSKIIIPMISVIGLIMNLIAFNLLKKQKLKIYKLLLL